MRLSLPKEIEGVPITHITAYDISDVANNVCTSVYPYTTVLFICIPLYYVYQCTINVRTCNTPEIVGMPSYPQCVQ